MSDDETDNQPIDLSFKHVTRNDEVTCQHSIENSLHSFTSTSNDIISPAVSSHSHESSNILASPLLSYLLLSNERATNMQQLLRLLQVNNLNRTDVSTSSIQSHDETSHEPRRCHADTTEHHDEDNQRHYIDRNGLNVPLNRKSYLSATIGRPLTGRYVRNGTGASESTLALLRQVIYMRMNGRLQERSTSSGPRRTATSRRIKKRM